AMYQAKLLSSPTPVTRAILPLRSRGIMRALTKAKDGTMYTRRRFARPAYGLANRRRAGNMKLTGRAGREIIGHAGCGLALTGNPYAKPQAAPGKGTITTMNHQLPASWRAVLGEEFKKPYFKDLEEFVD